MTNAEAVLSIGLPFLREVTEVSNTHPDPMAGAQAITELLRSKTQQERLDICTVLALIAETATVTHGIVSEIILTHMVLTRRAARHSN